MSTPEYPDGSQPEGQSPDAGAPRDEPTIPDAPTPAQPAPEAPTAAYPPAGPAAAPVYGSQPPAPAYGAARGYGAAPAYPGAPAAPGYVPGQKAPDTRPKTFGIIALVLGILTFFGGIFAFIPLAGLFIGIGAFVLGLGGVVLGIVTLASKKQGGKVLGGIGLGLSILGGIGATIGIIIWSLAFAVIGSHDSSTYSPKPLPSYSSSATDEPSEEPSIMPSETGSTGTAAEQAFLAEAKPQIVALIKEVEPSMSDAQASSQFSDQMLIDLGTQIHMLDKAGQGDTLRSALVKQLSATGKFSEEQAGRFYDIIKQAGDDTLG